MVINFGGRQDVFRDSVHQIQFSDVCVLFRAVLVVWIPGIPQNERDWIPLGYPDSNPKPPGPKPFVDWIQLRFQWLQDLHIVHHHFTA